MAITKKVAKVEKQPKHIGLVQNDSWLEPFEEAIRGRHEVLKGFCSRTSLLWIA